MRAGAPSFVIKRCPKLWWRQAIAPASRAAAHITTPRRRRPPAGAPEGLFTEAEAKRIVAEATGGVDVRDYGGDAIGGAGGGQPSKLAGGEIGGGCRGLRACSGCARGCCHGLASGRTCKWHAWLDLLHC